MNTPSTPQQTARPLSFTQGLGRWAGCAEVYDGGGRFVGNAIDTRHVQELGNGCVRIDVAFIGPLKAAGYYTIQDKGDHRLYQGPINIGYAETLAQGLVDANAYWHDLGLSQRFFLMVLPDDGLQLSLALMSRGEELIYSIVGENQRVAEGAATPIPALVPGSAYDLSSDPSAGRGTILLHRAGAWVGELQILDAARQPQGSVYITEQINADLQVEVSGGGYITEAHRYTLYTNGRQAWTPDGAVVGSYSLSGGRALSGNFYYPQHELRVWRREVVAHDGRCKAVVRIWYRGGERIGFEYGVLRFEGGV
jgi:hypothetical protein